MPSSETPPRADRIAPRLRMVVKDVTDQSRLQGTLWLIVALNVVLLGIDVIGHLRLSL
jgi:hypothetical protein